MIKIHDKEFIPYLTKESIHEKVKTLAQQINHDYKGKSIIIICIMDGSFLFTADLVRALNLPLEITFVKLSSYQGTKSKGSIDMVYDIDIDLKDKHVMIVEDIVDTGLTLSYFLKNVNSKNPKSVEVCSLISKPVYDPNTLIVKYKGFEIPNYFVVGYGMDYDQKGRDLPDIYRLKEEILG